MSALPVRSALLFLGACAVSHEPAEPVAVPATRIAWQRSLGDALRLAETTGRPLFVAINMDGESASERIVRETYRDPEFVARTRGCICVIGSLFRHNPRDHDADGQRIPCPRLGSVTCGEHIALEPQLFDRVLRGERVAPRHALFHAGGAKAFDESLLFDIRDLDRMLAGALRGWRQDAAPTAHDDSSFGAVTRMPFAAARARQERRLAAARDTASVLGHLEAIRRTGDAGWGDALRVALHRIPELGAGASATATLDRRLVGTARAIGATGALARAVRDLLTSIESVPADGRLPLRRAGDARLLRLLIALDSESAQVRGWLLGRAIDEGVTPPPTGHEPTVRTVVRKVGGAFQLESLLSLADRISRKHAGTLPRTGPITDAMPSVAVLLERLEELDERLQDAPGDAELRGALAKATLDLARQRMGSRARDVPLLLEDAARLFRQALAAEPDRSDWWIEAARTAYFQQDFARQAELGRRALAATLGDASLPVESSLTPRAPVLHDATAIEALRWIGDGEARLVASRGSEPVAAQARGALAALRALGLVAASPFGTSKDWVGLVSLLESFGLVRASVAANLCAAERLPADAELRQALRSILWSIGRIELAPAAARRVARRHPDSGAAEWFVGYAHLLAAEDHRRAEQPDAAIEDYERAERAFAAASAVEASLAASCRHYTGVAWLGRGMALLLAVRQTDAAEALVAAAGAGASIRTAKDGLERDVFDLVDQALEWRAGRPSPVDAIDLLNRLERADPGTAFWASAVSDAMLREGLRADGKNPQRVVRETIDAGGAKIRMPMGLPTESGDTYLALAIAAGRRAARHGDADKKPLAQALTVVAERALERLARGGGDPATSLELARRSLREAATLYEVPAATANAERATLTRIARALREQLGPARPRFRPGR